MRLPVVGEPRLPWFTSGAVPRGLADKPHRRSTVVMRPWDWALPPSGEDLEILSRVPAGWDGAPRAARRPPVLFVHGIGGAAWTFAEFWMPRAVRRGFPAHAVSLRGHGASGGTARLQRTLIRDYVHDVMQAIITLPEPPVLIGHSLGAVIVQEVIQRYPARAAVLVAPTPAAGIAGTVLRHVRRNPSDLLSYLTTGRPPERPELFFNALDHDTAVGYVRRFGRESVVAMLELGLPRHIGPVHCPVGVFGCRHDQLIGPADVRHTAQMYGVKPTWLPGVGHEVELDGGNGIALDIILDWVDEQVPVGSPPLGAAAALR